MGLTSGAVGSRLLKKQRKAPGEELSRIALAGNPNVGKSTVFNALTGMNQHTGNWAGKTVESAEGLCRCGDRTYRLIDLPGTYSLMAHSAEEEVARNYLCFDAPDGVVVVCDAGCMERNLNLILQILEVTPRVAVCMNIIEKTDRRSIDRSAARLSECLGVPVLGISARRRREVQRLRELPGMITSAPSPYRVRYPELLERAVDELEPLFPKLPAAAPPPRWVILRLLEGDAALERELTERFGSLFAKGSDFYQALEQTRRRLADEGYESDRLCDMITATLASTAERIADDCIDRSAKPHRSLDRRLDRLFTGKLTAYPIMLLLLLFLLFLTVSFSNIPSTWLSSLFFELQGRLDLLFVQLSAPDWLRGALVDGVFRTLGWVVSVMLPPMAIFFPLFTLLEDSGYLPRMAYDLDRPFCRCGSCGKQALTMCMGLGCNAAGVVGCRIIDSPRERLLGILTNVFMPCNGRFPALISVLSMFIVGLGGGLRQSLGIALGLLCVILLGVLVTFAVTRLLSCTLLRGLPSSFALELPPYRCPDVGRVLVRSLLDRTLSVLGRAVAIAAPAGLLIWGLANIRLQGISLLQYGAELLEPFAALMGLDGMILLGFLLGFPANEIVIPIILMGYSQLGALPDGMGDVQIRALLSENGWTVGTAVSVLIFFLLHFPCSTTLLTVKKETGSLRLTLAAAALPTVLGVLACMLWTAIYRLLT